MINDFDSVSKKEWLAKVRKDLKLEDLDSLDFRIGEVLVSPFAHAEDIQLIEKKTLTSSRSNNSWELIEQFNQKSESFNNEAITQSLENGASALLLHYEDEISENEIEDLLQGINPELIGNHFSGNRKSIKSTIKIFDRLGFDPKKIKGSITFFDEYLWKNSSSIFKYCLESKQKDDLIEIEDLIFQAYDQLLNFEHKEVTLQEYADRFLFRVKLGDDFLFNIAKIRAMRLLWNHLSDSFYLTPNPIKIVAEGNDFHFSDSLETQYIFSSIQVLSASIASADGILIHVPEDAKTNETFRRRITRNLHHLAAMESKMEKVIDPMAGSYHIEKLTNSVAEQVWNTFQIKIQNQ